MSKILLLRVVDLDSAQKIAFWELDFRSPCKKRQVSWNGLKVRLIRKVREENKIRNPDRFADCSLKHSKPSRRRPSTLTLEHTATKKKGR